MARRACDHEARWKRAGRLTILSVAARVLVRTSKEAPVPVEVLVGSKPVAARTHEVLREQESGDSAARAIRLDPRPVEMADPEKRLQTRFLDPLFLPHVPEVRSRDDERCCRLIDDCARPKGGHHLTGPQF